MYFPFGFRNISFGLLSCENTASTAYNVQHTCYSTIPVTGKASGQQQAINSPVFFGVKSRVQILSCARAGAPKSFVVQRSPVPHFLFIVRVFPAWFPRIGVRGLGMCDLLDIASGLHQAVALHFRTQRPRVPNKMAVMG